MSLALAAALVLAAGAQAGASAPGGWTIDAASKHQRQSDRFLQDYARCLAARTDPAALDRFLRTSPGAPSFGVQTRNIVSADCMPVGWGRPATLKAPNLLLRGILFEARVRAVPLDAIDIAAAPPLDLASEFTGGDDLPPTVVAVRLVGDCVVRRSPAAASRLVLTTAGSADEDRAIAGVMPALDACPTADEHPHTSRSMLRGILAEALFKMSAARELGSARQDARMRH